jgi:ribosomal subunit interface protein
VSEAPLEVVVHGRHVEVPETLKRSAARKTERLSRYLGGMERAEVCFSDSPVGRLGDPVTCEIVLVGHGRVVRSLGAGGRPAAALDAAVEKAELQLTRLKGRLVGRSRPRHRAGGRIGRTGEPETAEAAGSLDGTPPAEPLNGIPEP